MAGGINGTMHRPANAVLMDGRSLHPLQRNGSAAALHTPVIPAAGSQNGGLTGSMFAAKSAMPGMPAILNLNMAGYLSLNSKARV